MTANLVITRIVARTAAKHYNYEVEVNGKYLGTVPSRKEAIQLAKSVG